MGGGVGRFGGVLYERVWGGLFRVGVEEEDEEGWRWWFLDDDDDHDDDAPAVTASSVGVGEECPVEYICIDNCTDYCVFEGSSSNCIGWLFPGVFSSCCHGDCAGGG